ncbi:MAG TPA: histidine kinase [Miltoncostaeaceae bacterium]|nr:histidine kinase [Miltoncostaeaceae bacterium]
MSRRHTLSWCLLATGATATGLALWAALTSSFDDNPPAIFVFFALIALAWTTGGAAAARRPAGQRMGILMTSVGVTWVLGALTDVDNSFAFTLGLLLNNLWAAVLLHALLAFPSGRLEPRARLPVALGYVSVLPVQFAMVMVATPKDLNSCDHGCADNALLVTRNQDAFHALAVFQIVLAAVAIVWGVVLLIRSWRRATPLERRAIAPIVWLGSTAILMVIVGSIVSTFSKSGADVPGLISLTAFLLVPIAFVVGLVRARLARSAVGDLVVELGETPGPGGLRDALVRSLRDPSLEVAYWLPEEHAYVDAEGRPFPDPAPDRGTTLVMHAGERVAMLVHDPALAEQRELVDAATAAAGLALSNERLQAELRRRLEELRRSRARLVEAGDAERRRLERDLHDGAQQRLVALSLTLRLARSRLESDPAAAEQALTAAEEQLTQALAELRELARGIHPAVLSDHGLAPALRALADRDPLPVDLDVSLEERLPWQVEVASYFVVAESLTNVAKYAGASAVRIEVGRVDGRATVLIADDGVGGADPRRGSGLRGLTDRVEALDGRLTVKSPQGQGTTVLAEFPLHAE